MRLDKLVRHPAAQNAVLPLVLVFGSIVAVWSFLINPHSLTWLASVYLTLLLLILAWRQPRETPARSAFLLYLIMLLSYLGSVWILHMPGRDPESAKESFRFWLRFVGGGGVYLSVALFRFTLHFAGIRNRKWAVLEYAGWLVGGYFHFTQLAGWFFVDFFWTGHTWVPTMTAYYPSFFGFTSLFVTLGLAVPLVQVFRTSSRPLRMQLAFYLAGALPLFLSCWSNFLLSMGVKIYPAGGAFYLLHLLLLGYAAFYQQVFRVSVVIRRGLPYALVSVLFGLLFGGLMFVASRQIEELGLAANVAYVSLFLALAGLFYSPVFHVLQTSVDRLLFREKHDREIALAGFSRDVTRSLDLHHVLNLLCATLYNTLKPVRIRVFVCKPQVAGVSHFGTYEEGLKPGQLDDARDEPEAALWESHLAKFAPNMVQVINSLPVPPRNDRLGIILDEGAEKLVVPIRFQEQPLAFAVVSAKRSGEPFSREDRVFAETLAANSSVAMQNARSHYLAKAMQTRLHDAILDLPVAIVMLRADGRIEMYNKAFSALLECELSSPLSTLQNLKLADAELATLLQELAATGEVVENRPVRQVLPIRRFFLMSCRPMEVQEEEPLYLVVLHDLTEYKRMEDRLQKQEGLAAIGRFVSGINHEIRNAVQPLRTLSMRLTGLKIENAEYQKLADRFQSKLGLLDLLLRNLSDFARPVELRRRSIKLPQLLAAILVGLDNQVRESGVKIEHVIAPDAERAYADADWLGMVLHNLVKNASEALAGQRDGVVRIVVCRERTGTRICVEDNGPGIPPDLQAQLFEPFFSTKGSRGTGLGLSICRKIVELHEGHIEADSRPGEGTRFTILLPDQPQHDEAISASTETGSRDG